MENHLSNTTVRLSIIFTIVAALTTGCADEREKCSTNADCTSDGQGTCGKNGFCHYPKLQVAGGDALDKPDNGETDEPPAGACSEDKDCADIWDETIDVCVKLENDEFGICAYSAVEGFCLIGHSLYTDGETLTNNACLVCDSKRSRSDWSAVECDDGINCSVDTCDTETGCLHTSDDKYCDDGLPCTIQSCNLETGCAFDGIVAGACWISGACYANGDQLNACAMCDTDVDQLNWTLINQDEPCDDGNPCSSNTFCDQGACSGSEDDCDDGNPCTDDACEYSFGFAKGCTFTPNSELCDDGNPCTTDDVCTDTSCSGTTTDCDDEISCTTDSCHPDAGCLHEAIDGLCADGDVCNGIETCNPETGDAETGCTAGAPLSCDDGLPCNGIETCNAATGCTFGDPIIGCCMGDEQCDDGNLCNGTQACVDTTCVITAQPLVCDDGDVCNGTETCNAATGCTSGAEPLCDDGNVCTTDSCDPSGGCMFIANSEGCDDGDVCTEDDMCDSMECSGTKVECADGDVCNGTEWCKAGEGCVSGGSLNCDDGNVCNGVETCDAATGCTNGTPLNCDDGNPCTKDNCKPDTGCYSSEPATLNCDDGNPCTEGDICKDMKCSGTAISCDDGNPCTLDSCDPSTGCKNEPIEGSCDDGNPCTEDDVCQNNVCKGSDVSCDDDNSCTEDACTVDGGCVSTPNTSECNDGNACTKDDMCSDSACAGTAVECFDGNSCTDDACDPSTGCSFTKLNGLIDGCADGDLCNGIEACDDGTCKTVQILECDDDNQCTLDSCDPSTGCKNEPIEGSCDDGNPCTEDDVCQNNVCKGFNPCDDGNPCTVDLCDGESSCSYGQVSCDDGNPCTEDSCNMISGECVNTPTTEIVSCNDGDVCTTDDTCNDGVCSGTVTDEDADGKADGEDLNCDNDFDIYCAVWFLPEGHANTNQCAWGCRIADGTLRTYRINPNIEENSAAYWKCFQNFDEDGVTPITGFNQQGVPVQGGDCNNKITENPFACTGGEPIPASLGELQSTLPPGISVKENPVEEYPGP